MAAIIANADSAQSRFRERLERVEEFMENARMPERLRGRVRRYYAFLWHRNKGFLTDSSVLEGLSDRTRRDIMYAQHGDVLEKVPLFSGCPQPFMRELVMVLEQQFYCPDELIVQEGETGACALLTARCVWPRRSRARVVVAGNSMHLVSSGKVKVFGKSGRVFATLKQGDFFGELALLFPVARTASAKVRSSSCAAAPRPPR